MLFTKDINRCDAGGGALWDNESNGDEMLDTGTVSDSIPCHPLGVKPLGNLFFASGSNARQSLGNFGRLPDEMILHFLEYLQPDSLQFLGTTCRFLYAFCHLDELWKPLFLE